MYSFAAKYGLCVAWVVGFAILTGCATPPQTRQLLQNQPLVLNNHSKATNPLSLHATIQLNAVPFWPQTQYQCGPAVLAMALNTQGVNVTPEQLTPSSLHSQKTRSDYP